ncbi:hypothetical protein Hdeb2414_s0011g00370511 [Helianthus debilis subsp. tardiflorus]
MTVLPFPSPINIKFVFFLPTFKLSSSYLQNYNPENHFTIIVKINFCYSFLIRVKCTDSPCGLSCTCHCRLSKPLCQPELRPPASPSTFSPSYSSTLETPPLTSSSGSPPEPHPNPLPTSISLSCYSPAPTGPSASPASVSSPLLLPIPITPPYMCLDS